MAACDLCGQKLSFMGGETFRAGDTVQGISLGETYTLCDNCMSLVNAAKKQDAYAQNKIRILAKENIRDEHKRQWLLSYLHIQKTAEEIAELEKLAKEQEERNQSAEEYRKAEIARVMELVKEEQKNFPPVFKMEGCRGRSIEVYTDRAIIFTDVTLGSVLTSNATDGMKTIFYHDVVGIQYKEPAVTIGYLQLETASGQMNNLASNQFSENTFTFEKNTETVCMMKDYITWQVSQFKKK